jgi:hypothetical protein
MNECDSYVSIDTGGGRDPAINGTNGVRDPFTRRQRADTQTIVIKPYQGVKRNLAIFGVILGSLFAAACVISTMIGFACYLELIRVDKLTPSYFCTKMDIFTASAMMTVSQSIATVGIFVVSIFIAAARL